MKPRRTILSIPGHIEKMHHKGAASAADVVMLDLEDSVPVNEKKAARGVVVKALKEIDWGNKTVTLRVNPVNTPFCYRDLIEVIEAAGECVSSIVLPKVNNPGDVLFVSRMLNGIEEHMGFSNSIGIEAIIETATGMENISSIAACCPRLLTLVFGIADYSASIGAPLDSISGHDESNTNYPGHRWHYPMSRLVMAAKANNLQVIDAPYGNFKDPQALQEATQIARALGFDGKWAIHPAQLEIINKILTPSQEEVQRAMIILEAYQEAQSKGRGSIAVDGNMIDKATLRLAQKLYDQAKILNLI